MAPKKKTSRLLGYCRVSTEEQAKEGVSLSAQRTALRRYCALHDHELIGVVSDNGKSGATLAKRGALLGALSQLRGREADGLVVLKLDRLSRSTRDVLDLVDRSSREGWQLHSIREQLDTSTASGRFVVTVLGALGEMERAQTAERTKTALDELRRQGKRISGRPPLGYRFVGGKLVEVAAEHAVLERIKALRASGKGAKKIASELNEAGGKNFRTGRPWTYGTIQHFLKRIETERCANE